MSICSKCGKKTEAEALFCGYCGHDLSIDKGQFDYKKEQPDPFIRANAPLDNSKPKFVIFNTRRRIKWFWIVSTIMFLVLEFSPLIKGLKGMASGYDFRILFGFMILLGLLMSGMYNELAKQMDKVLDSKFLLARWHICAEDWQKYSTMEFSGGKKVLRMLHSFLVILFYIFGIILWAIFKNAFVMLVISGLIVFIFLPQKMESAITRSKQKKFGTKILISEHGVIVGSKLHFFSKKGKKIDKVTLVTKDTFYLLEFDYELGILGKERTGGTFRVPVPYENHEEGKQIAAYYNLKKKD